MRDLIKETLEKIKKEEIKPTSRWVFLAKNIFTWLALLCLVVLGVISFSLIIFLISQLDWEICSQMGIRLHWLSPVFYVPIFWFLLSILFAFLAFREIRKTKKGYRYNSSIIVLVLTAVFSVFGFFFYLSRESERVHGVFSGQNSNYKKMSELKERQWSQPELGFLGGIILQIGDTNSQFKLMDFEEHNWVVNYDDDLIIMPGVLLLPNERVKIIGQEIEVDTDEEDDVFQAREIRPWEGSKGPGAGKVPGKGCPDCQEKR